MHDDGYRVKSTGICCGGKCGDDDFYIVAEDDGDAVLVEGPYEGNGMNIHSRVAPVAAAAGVDPSAVKMVKLGDIPKTIVDFRTSEVAEGEPEFESLEFRIGMEDGVQTLFVQCGLMEFGMSLPRFYTWMGRVMKALFAIEEVLAQFKLRRIEGPDALVSEGSEYPFTLWATWTFEGDMETVCSVLLNKGLTVG